MTTLKTGISKALASLETAVFGPANFATRLA